MALFDSGKSTGGLLAVDFLNLFYRSLHRHQDLSHEGKPTGALFGMVSSLGSMISELRPDRIVFCVDSKPYFRELDFSGYKEERKRRAEKDPDHVANIQVQRATCLEFVRTIGLPVIEIKGLEADDVIAMIAFNCSRNHSRVIAASTDTDLYQLFGSPNFVIHKGKGKLYGAEQFDQDYPELNGEYRKWVDVQAYSGGHNGLHKIKGIAEATAIKLVSGAPVPASVSAKVRQFQKEIEENRKLSALPYYRFADRNRFKVPTGHRVNVNGTMAFLVKHGVRITDHVQNTITFLRGC